MFPIYKIPRPQQLVVSFKLWDNALVVDHCSNSESVIALLDIYITKLTSTISSLRVTKILIVYLVVVS